MFSESLKGIEGERERESDRAGESVRCCDIVIAVKVELNKGEERGDVCADSVTAVEGREGLTGIERTTEKEKQKDREVV